MSAVPATKARRIGDILLELGFAAEDDIAKATLEQEKTGQPLGQILVELGVITRLELASALAEQWSDQSASIKLLPIPPPASVPRPAPEPHHDDDQYAARLQDAVAELALRVGAGAGAAQPTEEFDDRVTDLAERVEATVARTQRIEATLATLAESFEGVTGGVEEAFSMLQSGMAGLTLDLARIDTTVAELATHSPDAPAADPELAARLEELSAAVAALAERPVADPATDSRLEALAAHVESLVEATETPDASLVARIEDIAAAVAMLAERPVADPAAIESRLDSLAARVDSFGESDDADEFRASLHAIDERLAALAERPVVDPAEVDGRLNALASRVENVVTPDEVVALHDSLVAFEQRLAVLAEDAGSTAALDEQARSLADQARSLAELRATVVELESRPVGDPALDDRLARIETEVAERLAAKPDATAVEALANRLDASADEHESLATAVAQIGVRIDEMTWRDDGATTRLEELQEQVQSIASGLADVRHGLMAQEDVGVPQRLDELGQSLAVMRDEVAALARSITPAERVEQIAARIEELAAERGGQLALAARVEAVEGRFTEEDLTEMRARLAEVSTTPELVTDPAVLQQLEALAARIEELAEDREAEASLAAKLDDLERRLPAEHVTPDELASAIAAAREELAASAPDAADPRVDELSAEVAAMRRDLVAVRDAPVPTGDDSAVRAEIEALARRIEDLPAPETHDDAPLLAKIEALEERLEAPAGADPRIDQLAQDIAAVREQLAAVESTSPQPDSALVAKLEELAERVDAPAAGDPRVEQLLSEIETVREQIAKVERTPVTDPVVASELDTLSQRLRFVDARLNEEMATSSEVTRAVDSLRATAADELQRLVDERVGEQVSERVAALTQGLEERLAAAAEAQPRTTASATGDTTGLEDLLERNRMTIERLGLHLGEHDRALAELMRSRDLPKRIDELAARVEEIAGGAPAGGGGKQAAGTRREIGTFNASEPSTGEVKALMRRVEDAEVASQADREKLMNRLERMASSIDWRLQRLESTETPAGASSSDDD